MKRSPHSFVLLLCVLAGCAGTGGVAKDPRYASSENLLDIVTNFHRFSREDLYRYPVPKDLAGIDVHKATLVRLKDYEENHPGRHPDVIMYTRAMAYERLREYGKAMDAYRLVVEMDSSPLSPEARTSLEALGEFQAILEDYGAAEGDPAAFVAHIEEKASAWRVLAEKYRGTVYEYLALIEGERMDRLKTEYLQVNRHRLQGGNDLVIEAYQVLITTHASSKHRNEYVVELADFFVALAKEYARVNPPPGRAFRWQEFSEWANKAWRLYADVAEKDGSPEKVEAQGKLQALQAYLSKVRAASQ